MDMAYFLIRFFKVFLSFLIFSPVKYLTSWSGHKENAFKMNKKTKQNKKKKQHLRQVHDEVLNKDF